MRFMWLGVLTLVALAGCTDATDTVDTDADTDPATEADTDPGTESPFVDCDFTVLDEWAVDCGGATPDRMVLERDLSDDPECPDLYSIGDVTRTDPSDALSAAECDDTCVYRANIAVMVLYCGSRGEYIAYEPGGPGQDGDGAACDPLVQAMTNQGSGWYETFEAYQADFPCPDNQAPTLTDIETSDAEWTSFGGPIPVTDTLVVSDADDTELMSATITLDSGYQPGADSLLLTSRPVNIGTTWDSRTATLTLSGQATVAGYQGALRTIAFDTTSTSALARTVTIEVSDGDDTSEPVSRTIQVAVPEEQAQ